MHVTISIGHVGDTAGACLRRVCSRRAWRDNQSLGEQQTEQRVEIEKYQATVSR